MFATLLALAAAQAVPPPQAPTSSPATAQVSIYKPQQVCRMAEVTGTRMRARVCTDRSGKLVAAPGVSNTLSTKVRGYQDPQSGSFSSN